MNIQFFLWQNHYSKKIIHQCLTQVHFESPEEPSKGQTSGQTGFSQAWIAATLLAFVFKSILSYARTFHGHNLLLWHLAPGPQPTRLPTHKIRPLYMRAHAIRFQLFICFRKLLFFLFLHHRLFLFIYFCCIQL